MVFEKVIVCQQLQGSLASILFYITTEQETTFQVASETLFKQFIYLTFIPFDEHVNEMLIYSTYKSFIGVY